MTSHAPSKILCVHPNGELYGSDRVFLQALRALASRWPQAAITARLPIEGALADEARKLIGDVRIAPILVLRRANLMATALHLLRLPQAVLRARALMRQHDLVYISTVTPIDHLLATRFVAVPVMIHVHELPTGRIRTVITAILRRSHGHLIFISNAVRDAFPALADRASSVIWNGVRAVAGTDAPEADDRMRILLIGRFNAWKGQSTLIAAIARLTAEQRERVTVRLVGSAYTGQDHFLHEANDLIARLGLSERIEICDFAPVPDPHYRWADLVVVPSTKPEPFGLVAIEAMSAGRAVIAADHGGLREIVRDGQTGRLVPPADVARLTLALQDYIAAPETLKAHGRAGRARYEAHFREATFIEKIGDTAAAQLAS